MPFPFCFFHLIEVDKKITEISVVVVIQVLMLDMTSLSVLFRTDCTSGTNSAVISASMPSISQCILQVSSPEQLSPCITNPTEVVLTLTKDSQIAIMDSRTGAIIGSRTVQPKKESVVISMHVIGMYFQCFHQYLSLVFAG